MTERLPTLMTDKDAEDFIRQGLEDAVRRPRP